ncbi:MAG: protein-L-isoaspartate(D-aspartate) O-methyltransferase [Acidobacteriota bacterium]|jgi:protein-L-isoaspartate(D-aspartate) O-methyltransferase|nr:protein-L-isoaspartate(D-aspartate) O-methyltransferase [Acidobacteriota bacterium]
MNLDEIRQYYAEEIRAVANIQSEALVAAFAKVPREHFLGPGPWQIANPDSWQAMTPNANLKGGGSYRTTETDDPKHLYHNILIAIDAERKLNNGQPGSLASWIDTLELQMGDRVLHVGCGVGYYTAIIAEVVGAGGHVWGVEIDPDLAERARRNLAYLNHVEVVEGNGREFGSDPVDAIFINAGATQPQAVWLDSLKDGGRLILPLTVARDETSGGMGFMLKVDREEKGYAARFISPVAIFPCIGSRDAESNQRLREAMSKGTWGTVQSLRREPHEPSETCWLHGEDFCLSTLPLDASA